MHLLTIASNQDSLNLGHPHIPFAGLFCQLQKFLSRMGIYLCFPLDNHSQISVSISTHNDQDT
uniref:Uncharacterized protein n=1 Tax=Rhizophora mucronata TaxID=61149 RepID=A0A2P2NXF4_RHIMU